MGKRESGNGSVTLAAQTPEVQPVMRREVVREITSCVVELPLCEPITGYIAQGGFVSISTNLKGQAAVAFRHLWHGLREQGETLSSGRPVDSKADALLWLMESVAKNM